MCESAGGAELIAFAAHGKDVAGALGMVLDALAEHGDVDIDGAGEGRAVAPDFVEQIGAAEDGAAMFNQLAEQEKLFGWKWDEAALFEDAAAEEVDVDIAEVEAGGRGGGGRTAEHGFDAGVDFAGVDGFDEHLVGGGFEEGDFLVDGGGAGEDEDGEFGTEAVDFAAELDGGAVGVGNADEDGVGGGEALGLDGGAG